MITIEQRNTKLGEAQALILKGWCQETHARDRFGARIEFERDEAVAFCAIGACCRVANIDEARFLGTALQSALESLGYPRKISLYNDTPGRTKYEVAALFDHAKLIPLPEGANNQ